MKEEIAMVRLRDAIRIKHFSYRTERCYCGWLARYFRQLRTPRFRRLETSEAKVEAFLTDLAKSDCAASTQNQAFDAIRFFYTQVLKRKLGDIDSLRAKRPVMARVAPEREDTLWLLGEIKDVGGYPTNLIARLIYGCGLRVSEPLNLRIKDVLFRRSCLVVRAGKGRKDRIVPLPCSLIVDLKSQIAFTKVLWERDARDRVPVNLPNKLDVKYPGSRFEWQWYWVFPALGRCRHPRTRELVRWRCHEANVQRAVREARKRLGLSCISPHHLRHGYATDALEHGANIRDVQSALGHAQINTTMGYVRADAMRVRSPLEFAAT